MEFYFETGPRLKWIFFTILTVGSGMVSVDAACIYSRTEYKVSACVPTATIKDSFVVQPSTPELALPGLEETPTGPLDQLVCECNYVLQGSDPLCDGEKTQEFSQLFPQDPAVPTCPRGKSLCAGLCPKKIN